MPSIINRPPPLPGARVNYALPISKGLVAFYPMTERGGSYAHDVAGNWHAFIFDPTVTRWANLNGRPCLSMGETGGAVAIATGAPVPWSPAFTVVLWANPLTYNNRWARVIESSAADDGFSIEFDSQSGVGDQQFYFNWWNESNVLGQQVANTVGVLSPLNQWAQLAMTADQAVSTGHGYIDGQRIGSTTHTVTVPPAFFLNIGLYGGGTGNGFNGWIGPVGYWNRALSASDIAALYIDPYAPLRRTSLLNYRTVAALLGRSVNVSQAVNRAATY